eukprot:958085_1
MVHDINVETEVVFYRGLLDSMHCYVYHLEDVGLRVFTKCRSEQNVAGIEDDNTDLQLGHIRTMQRSKARILHENGLKMSMHFDKANKYDLTPHMQSTEKYQFKGTLMDKLFDFISTRVSNIDECQSFFAVLSDEEYDSESVKYDLEDTSQSNLALHNIACYDAVERYFYLAKLHHYTFSIGYRFYYQHWLQFKSEILYSVPNMANTPENDDPNDIHSHPIRSKYKSLQYEILNNTISNIPKTELNLSVAKSDKYIVTRKAK